MKTTIVTSRAARAPLAARGSDFIALLRAELARRCTANPRYSLRAFARRLGIDHATLSQLLRGRRTLTAAMIRRLGARLELDAAAIQAHAETARRTARVTREPEALREVRQLTADAASLVQEWHPFAILELTRLDCFRPDSRWIARVLGIGVDQVNVALQQLLRLELLAMPSRTCWVDTTGDAAVTVEGLAHLAVERLAQRARELARRSPAAPDGGTYDHSATTIAVHAARLPEVIERITRFRRELLAWLEQDARRDDLYQLDIGFYPITTLTADAKSGRPP